MSWVRVAWSKCTLLYVSYMLVQISFFISSTYIVFVFIDPKISTPMNQGRVPHNNLSFHRCIPPSYHNFIKWRPSTLDPVPRSGRPRNFVTMGWIGWRPQAWRFELAIMRAYVFNFASLIRWTVTLNFSFRRHGVVVVIRSKGSKEWVCSTVSYDFS